jgi:DNA-binding LacI/PurR family transcriptional regulator
MPAGIREIAEALSISITTVDRALHARPGVSKNPRQSAEEGGEAKIIG